MSGGSGGRVPPNYRVWPAGYPISHSTNSALTYVAGFVLGIALSPTFDANTATVGRSSAVRCDRTCEWVDTPARGVGHIRFVNGVRWLGDTALPGTILLTYS